MENVLKAEINGKVKKIIAIQDKKGNYFIVKQKDDTEKFHKYLHCAIIPIVFNDDFTENTLEVDDLGNLNLGNVELDFFSGRLLGSVTGLLCLVSFFFSCFGAVSTFVASATGTTTSG